MLEQYQIEQQISHKAGRRSYLAQDTKTSNQVVIKILEFNDLFNWDDLKLFEREAKTLKNLSHPYIPNYLDYFEIDEANRQNCPKRYRCATDRKYFSAYALVQTYINAPSLAELIQQGIKFSEVEIIELARKILDILDYLHKLNPPVIHRDIKPSNILLTNRSGNSIGDVYLVDFGSVQTVAKKEAGTITIVGSYGYIPLEQFMGQTTFASDLYSLGMTLIYLVSGIHPAELTQNTGKVKFDKSKISLDFARWLSTITEPYIDKRYASAEIALAALHSEEHNYQTNKLLSYCKSTELLSISSDNQTLEIIYEHSHIDLGCLLGLGVFFPANIFLSVILDNVFFSIVWSFLISLIFSFVWNAIFPPKPKYRIISLNKHKQIREGFYVQDRKNLEWQNSLPSQIERIIYSPSYTFNKCLDPQKKLIPGAKVDISAKLSIVVGHEEICIRELKTKAIAISDNDLWWLGNTIGNFLDLELEIISQTPVIPNFING